MKTIKQTLFCMLITLLSFCQIRSMEEQTSSIRTIEDLQGAMRSFAQEQFDQRKLLVFDGADRISQCHINALMVVELAHEGKRFEELRPEQQAFLVNNCLRSESLCLTSNQGPKVLERLFKRKLSSVMKSSLRSGQSRIVKEISGQLIDAQRTFFDQRLGEQIGLRWEKVAFDKEGLSILPKFVGIKSFLEHLKRRGTIWMMLKCKITCEQEEHILSLLISPDQQQFIAPHARAALDIDSQTPVIVIEGKTEIQHFECLRQLDPERFQLAIAAAWMEEKQPDASEKLSGDLLEEFNACLLFARDNGLSFKNIDHMFPDTFQHALERDRRLVDDTSADLVLDQIGAGACR